MVAAGTLLIEPKFARGCGLVRKDPPLLIPPPPHPNPPPRPSRDGGLTCAPPRGLFGLGGQCGHIEDVVTDVGARGGGLGRRIVEHLTGLARARGCYKVILDCAEDNAGFYAKCGFRRKEVQMVQYFEQESSGGSSRGV